MGGPTQPSFDTPLLFLHLTVKQVRGSRVFPIFCLVSPSFYKGAIRMQSLQNMFHPGQELNFLSFGALVQSAFQCPRHCLASYLFLCIRSFIAFYVLPSLFTLFFNQGKLNRRSLIPIGKGVCLNQMNIGTPLPCLKNLSERKKICLRKVPKKQ